MKTKKRAACSLETSSFESEADPLNILALLSKSKRTVSSSRQANKHKRSSGQERSQSGSKKQSKRNDVTDNKKQYNSKVPEPAKPGLKETDMVINFESSPASTQIQHHKRKSLPKKTERTTMKRHKRLSQKELVFCKSKVSESQKLINTAQFEPTKNVGNPDSQAEFSGTNDHANETSGTSFNDSIFEDTAYQDTRISIISDSGYNEQKSSRESEPPKEEHKKQESSILPARAYGNDNERYTNQSSATQSAKNFEKVGISKKLQDETQISADSSSVNVETKDIELKNATHPDILESSSAIDSNESRALSDAIPATACDDAANSVKHSIGYGLDIQDDGFSTPQKLINSSNAKTLANPALSGFDIPSSPPSSGRFAVSEIMTPLGSPSPSYRVYIKKSNIDYVENTGSIGSLARQKDTNTLTIEDSKNKENLQISSKVEINNSDTLINDTNGSFFFQRNTTKPKRQFQSFLNFADMRTKKTTCKDCFMAYMPNIKEDETLHKAYHNKYINGLSWNETWGKKVLSKIYPPKLRNIIKTSIVQRDGYIREVQMTKKNEIKTILNLLKMVNNELNAPADWFTSALGNIDDTSKISSKESFNNVQITEAARKGKVYVYIYNRKIIGVLSLETVDPNKSGTKLMDIDTQEVTTLSKNSPLLAKLPKALYGISRIFVLKKFRRSSIALILLYTALNELVYGMNLNKYQLSWSQPSFSGLNLAKKFNLITDVRSKRQFLNVYVEAEEG